MLQIQDIQTIELFLDYLKKLNGAPMFIYQEKHYSYLQMSQYTLSISQWLSKHNISALMFSISNSPLSAGLFFASWRNNIKCIPVNPRFIANELLGLIKRVKPDCVIVEPQQLSDELTHYCQQHNIKIHVLEDPMVFLTEIKQNYFSDDITLNYSVLEKTSEGITYHISSGTGGHYNFHGHYTHQILQYAYARQFDYGLNKGDISLVHLSFNHAYAFSYQLLPNLALGNCMVLASAFEAKSSLRYITQHNITALALLPTMYYQLCQESIQSGTPQHRLKHLSVAGDQPTDTLMKLVKKTFNTPLLNGLGMTEVYGYAQNLEEANQYNKLKLFHEVQIKLQPISHDELNTRNRIDNNKQSIGEIYLKTAMQPISHQDQWLPTGDYGYMDEAHNLYFLGRIKDIIVKGGSKISPLELEHYLYQMPHIKQVAVVGKADPFWGEIICACILLNANHFLTLETINLFLAPYLSSYKHIDEAHFYTHLPLNITGKIDRYRLKRELHNEQSA